MVHHLFCLFLWMFEAVVWIGTFSLRRRFPAQGGHGGPRLGSLSIHNLVVIALLSSSVMANTDHTDYSHCSNKIYDKSVRSGSIVSPGFPNYFQKNICKLWSINLMTGYNITITFNLVEIPKLGDTCESYLEIGPMPLVRLCGNHPKATITPYTSKRELVWIRFYTRSTSKQGKGFDLEFVTSPVPTNSCPDGQYLCANGKCIMSKWKCNGISECGDKSDEMGCPHRYTGNECGHGQFLCKSTDRHEYECFSNTYRCDGRKECLDGQDEENCEHSSQCGEQLTKLTGYITSPLYDRKSTYPKNKDCNWTIHVTPGHVMQFRFVAFDLARSAGSDLAEGTGDLLTFYNGRIDDERYLIGKYNFYHNPPKTVESSVESNWVFIKFHSGFDVMDGQKRGFNMSFQQKGTCLPSQNKCDNEEDCYNPMDKCDGLWDCQRHGSDERGCDKCDPSKFPCGSSNQCYKESEHCDGMGVCFDNKDEMNCTPENCNSNNGTYLCHNFRCIYESWMCDGRDDCGDNSDELNCTVPSVRVILAAVVGSLVCALLLVIAIGCIIRLFSVRFHEHHGGSRYETPMSRIQAEFMRRQAPPTYSEAMRTSRPFSEFIAQIRSATTHRGSRSRNNSDVDLLVPSSDDEHEQINPSTEGVDSPRRRSNTSDVTASSSDSSLILIDSSEPGPSNATYDQELIEELSPNMTSCIDISAPTSAGTTTVQWTRENHENNTSNQELAASSDTTEDIFGESEPIDDENLCSAKSNCDSVDSAAEIEDGENPPEALGSQSSDISQPEGDNPDPGVPESAESAACLPTSQLDHVAIDTDFKPNSNDSESDDITDPLPSV